MSLQNLCLKYAKDMFFISYKSFVQRQAIYGGRCGPQYVCCRRPLQPNRPPYPQGGQCGRRYTQGINGRNKNPVYVDGDSEFGEYFEVKFFTHVKEEEGGWLNTLNYSQHRYVRQKHTRFYTAAFLRQQEKPLDLPFPSGRPITCKVTSPQRCHAKVIKRVRKISKRNY